MDGSETNVDEQGEYGEDTLWSDSTSSGGIHRKDHKHDNRNVSRIAAEIDSTYDGALEYYTHLPPIQEEVERIHCCAETLSILLPNLIHHILEGILPGVHLDHSYAVDHLVHHLDSTISDLSCLEPEKAEVTQHNSKE